MAAGGIFLATPAAVGAGTRLAVKDLLDTADLTTTYGSAIFAEHVPVTSAASVLLAETAGYANVGKTNLHEFAYGITSENAHFGTVRNPLASGRIAGGSSGGSGGARAAGLADAALGTDSGGSIRIPAACCGVVGFKPSFGLVPIGGVFPLAPSYDHAGPMARDVGGCVAIMRALVPGFPAEPLESLAEVEVDVAWVEHADPLVRARVEAAAALFPRRRAVVFPEPVGRTAVFIREVANVHRELYAEHGELYGENVAPKIERCLAVGDAEFDAARAARREHERLALEALDGVDLLLTPTLAFVAPPADVDEIATRERFIRFTYPF